MNTFPSTSFEIFHFQPVNCPSQNPVSPKVFNRFSKTLPHLKRVESGHLGRKFHMSRYFSFAKTRWKLSPLTRFEISHFQPVNCPSKNPISPKVFWPIFQIFASSHKCWKTAFGPKILGAQVFYFCNGRWKLRPSTIFEISHFQPVNCRSKNPISPKVFDRFSKTLLHLIRVETGYLGRKFHVSRYFSFEMSKWKLRPSTRFEIFHFQTVNRTSKNPISPKVFNRF